MSCSSPVPRYWSATVNPSGRRSLVRDFNKSTGSGVVVYTACGACIRCKIDRATDWSIRIMHEASLYDNNCFITLTYSNDKLPTGNSLVKSHYQDFMKRLREWSARRDEKLGRPLTRIRFYACGEYGDKFGRPHYHAIIMNFNFDDLVLAPRANSQHRVYSSKTLERLWGHGICEIGSVTRLSAHYVARYCTKKITGEKAAEHYHYVDAEGRSHLRLQEFQLNSVGLGGPWLEKFLSDVYTSDFVYVDGGKLPPPRYYDKVLERLQPEFFERIKKLRAAREREAPDYSSRKFYAREEITRAKLAVFAKRTLE